LSARVSSQVTHPVPSVPQLESDAALHAPPEQHPEGQELELQTHTPPEHSCPAPHGAPNPHVQTPLAKHLSVLLGSQAVHVMPPSPHVENDGVSHVEPEQQPDMQLAMQPLQLPDAEQVCGVGHDWHAPPPFPQAPAVSPGWQVWLASQQPSGHEVALQTHLPPEQICPAAQATAPPQVHAPAVQASAVAPHATHAEPAFPHAVVASVVVHVDPEQHPLAHDVASQTQAPPEQTWPALHAAPVPQAHAPEAEQRSDFVVSHAWHATPSVPQLGKDGTLHAPPEQQPVGHDVELQTHTPAEHSRPAPHAAPAPHLQAPAVQLSAVAELHATHAAPAEPHAPSEGVLHVSPEQQPPGHVLEHPLHAPLLHVSPPEQLWHAEPPLPQAPELVPASHTAPLQQPVGHDVPSQTQVPPRHRWPVVQAAPVPQAQAPFAPHPSASMGSHVVQAAPAVPQAVLDGGVQVAPSQHPLGHEVASHAHTPTRQT